MEITWYGHSCFRITQRNYATIVTDPFDSEAIGYSSLKIKGDVVTVSHDSPGHNNVAVVDDVQHVLTGPGEYEIGGVFIQALPMHNTEDEENPHYNIVYVIDFEGVNILHLGDLNHIPNQSAIENLGEIHVALVPVGGGGSLTASQASEVISLLEPGIVVPMHYQTEQTTLELDPLERFLKEMGLGDGEEIEHEDSLKVSSGSSMPEQTQVVVLAVKE